MTLQELRCFTAVARTLNFARAAEQLFMSQPAVSRLVKSLEGELGVQLLQRNRQQVTLTPAGLVFFQDTADILDRLELAKERVCNSTAFLDTLHVGCESMVQLPLLPDIYREYRKLCPDIWISNTELPGSERVRRILSGQLDVMFCVREGVGDLSGIQYVTLERGWFCCVLPDNHRFSGRKSVRIEELDGEVLIFLDAAHCPPDMETVQRDLRHFCGHARFYLSGSSHYSIPMIEGGLGIAVMPNFVVPPSSHICTVPLETERKTEYGIAWNSQDTSRKVQQFVQLVQKLYNRNKNTAAS